VVGDGVGAVDKWLESMTCIGVRTHSALGGDNIARILHDSCPKKYQNTRICMIFATKIKKIREFYTIFARKMPEFYAIIARKKYFPEF